MHRMPLLSLEHMQLRGRRGRGCGHHPSELVPHKVRVRIRNTHVVKALNWAGFTRPSAAPLL